MVEHSFGGSLTGFGAGAEELATTDGLLDGSEAGAHLLESEADVLEGTTDSCFGGSFGVSGRFAAFLRSFGGAVTISRERGC